MDPETLLCSRCGYVIEGLPHDGSCPECGVLLSASQAEARVGSPWQQAPGVRSLLVALWGVATRPRASWARVAVDRPSSSALLWANCLLAAAIFPGVAMVATAVHYWRAAPLAVAASVIWFILLLGCGWIETIGIRTISRFRKYRITADVAYAVVGHASAGWILGAIAGAVVAVVMRIPGDILTTMRGLGIGAAVAAGGGLLLFELLTYLGMRRMKYANRPRRIEFDADTVAGSV